jgi:hypothetical protein
MPETIYLVERVWYDPLGSDDRAAGYSIAGYVPTEDEAKAVVENGREIDPKVCWAFKSWDKPIREFRFKAIEKFVKGESLLDSIKKM